MCIQEIDILLSCKNIYPVTKFNIVNCTVMCIIVSIRLSAKDQYDYDRETYQRDRKQEG